MIALPLLLLPRLCTKSQQRPFYHHLISISNIIVSVRNYLHYYYYICHRLHDRSHCYFVTISILLFSILQVPNLPPIPLFCDPPIQEHWSFEGVVYPRPDSLRIYCVSSEHLARIVIQHFYKTFAAYGFLDRGNS